MSSQIHVELSGHLPLGEKRKLLNKFITKVEEGQVNNILKDCESLPSSQYNLLKLLLADKFHRFDLIIELLYKGDSDIISGALSKRWLYEGENNSFTDCEFLLNKLFPNVSRICRGKVLHKIGRYVKNGERVDQIWNGVEQRYGFDVAFPLLQSCSKAKINSVIANRKEIELSGYQLVQILQKYPDIGLEYLKNNAVGRWSSTNPNCSPLIYIYKNHPEDFLDLCINNSDKIRRFKLGRVRSTNMIRTNRAKLLEHPAETTTLLKFERIRRELSKEEFQMLFESSMPTESRNVSSNSMWKWVSTAPINKRLEMTNQAFMKLYQINLLEHPELMKINYLMLLPDDERMAVVQWKIENGKETSWSFKGISKSLYADEKKQLAWLLLKPISHSVPELQKRLLIEQDVDERAALSEYLIQTCCFNDAQPELLHVLKLLSKRSRNDQSEVRDKIFKTLCSVMDEMEFTKDHWDIIIEMIQVALVFKDKCDHWTSAKEKLVRKCLAFHIASKLPLTNLVSMHIKLMIQKKLCSWTNSHITNPAHNRTLLESYVKEVENLQQAGNLCSYNGISLDPKKLQDFIIKLIEEICSFNDSEDVNTEPISISSYQWLRDSFEQIAKEEEARVNENYSSNSSYSLDFAERLIDIIVSLRKDRNMSLDAFNTYNGSEDLNPIILVCSPNSSILMHYLRKDPSYLIQRWSTAVPEALKTESTVQFMKKLKYWNYSTFVNETIGLCLEIVSQTTEKDGVKQKCNAVLVLSVIRKPSEFLALVAEYYPPEAKVDVFAENSDEDYQIRQTFAKSLVNVIATLDTFPAIEKFCVGDYLKLAIGALYSQINRASEVEALNFLRRKLVNIAVSLQKHIIRLYLAITTADDRIRVLNDIESTNVSIRYEKFLQAAKLFRSIPSQETWMILKTSIEKASTDDVDIVEYLYTQREYQVVGRGRRARISWSRSKSPLCVGTCPVEYIPDYIETCIALLRKVEPDKVGHFLCSLSNIMDKVPEEILDDIILYEHIDRVSFESSFCVQYLYSCTTKSTLEHRLSNVWFLLQNVIRNGWDVKKLKHEKFTYPTRSLVSSFISNLYQKKVDVSSKWLKQQICQTLLAKLKGEPLTFFKEILHLELTLMLIKELDDDAIERLRSFGRSLARFIDSLAAIHGGDIIWIVKDMVKDCVKKIFSNELNEPKGVIVELIDAILDTSKTRQNQIISLTFLPENIPEDSHLIDTLQKITTILKDSDDVIVQLYGSTSTSPL